ncbi:hypothetical protein GCM10009804_03510 [Kribbella hippodromi]|uniref:Nucleotidyltransferase AbiEii toxin of type IV toxin-antitoxin system n=1 Tax=Kribbella hippodromi TaxID=434347 RepID=A0ABP4MTU7_9ACTN
MARSLLDELGLVARWSRYGDVTVVGSVGIGVVVAPDIDLEVRGEVRVADGFAVMAALAELPKVRRITYLDARDRHERGQYWKLEYELTDAVTWTVDTWVFDPGAPGGGALTAAVRDALGVEERDVVLMIKEEAAAVGERAPGYWLYQAVLDGGVRSYAEFRGWLGDRNIYERTGWLPTI